MSEETELPSVRKLSRDDYEIAKRKLLSEARTASRRAIEQGHVRRAEAKYAAQDARKGTK